MTKRLQLWDYKGIHALHAENIPSFGLFKALPGRLFRTHIDLPLAYSLRSSFIRVRSPPFPLHKGKACSPFVHRSKSKSPVCSSGCCGSDCFSAEMDEGRDAVRSNIVVVFDFDLTILDCDCDPWIMEKLGVSQLFEALLTTLPWNTAVDKMMGELHSQGKTIADIEKAAKTVPLYPATARAIRRLHSLGCDLRIVSDANMFFIKTILAHHGLLQCFTEIKSNPAFVEENGRLRVKPYHSFTTGPPHGCPLCPPNMCKGAIIEGMKDSMSEKKFFYLGDGSGDFCPSLKLGPEDCVLPRKQYPLWDLIQLNQEAMKAEVHGWTDAQEMEELLSTLIL